ncbi:MAG TPA: DUF2799 domain-containing protein [Psychromonas sp.]
MKYLWGILTSVCILAGCANTTDSTLSCTDRDWKDFGKEMAETGRQVRTIDGYKANCSGFGDDDLNAYLDGYSLGLISYCTYENGFKRGENNLVINNICPHEIQENYVRGYESGQVEYELSMDAYDKLQEDAERRSDDEFRTWNRDQQAQ